MQSRNQKEGKRKMTKKGSDDEVQELTDLFEEQTRVQ